MSWLSSALRRLVVLGGAAIVAGIVIREMVLVLKVEGFTAIESIVLVLFAVNTLWIALPFVTAIVGVVRLLVRRGRTLSGGPRLTTRTALIMPLYNEDSAHAAAALEAMADDVAALGEGPSFDIFVLSDTTDGRIALAEREVMWTLRTRLAGRMAVYYRRRIRNTAHKSGNIREFCERWGGAYDHLLVLDADSLMDGVAIVELARRMEHDPDAGLIQTVPRLQGATTLVSQMQQFATTVYGPPLAAGFAWWTQSEGNYFGHNAIIRLRAFMDSAGLPTLPGGPPFGGHVLSHDFVEAAFLRRAGWKVVLADDVPGSYEASPPTLIDLSIRDRRWCQGNLQHLRILTAKGLHWISRLHLLTGILTFVSSPLWLLFLLATLALGVQNEFAKPEYFSRTYTLFPLWPHLDPVRALRLFLVTLAILLTPKILGLLLFSVSPRRLRGAGPLFPLSIAAEWILSALVAPVLMLVHCAIVASIAAGRDAGWSPQRRSDSSLPWTQVAYRHRWHFAVGLGLAWAGHSVSWQMLAWLSPAIAGMVAAFPVSLATGSPWLGKWSKRLGLLRTPLDANRPTVARKAADGRPIYQERVAAAPDLAAIVRDPESMRRHLATTDRGRKQDAELVDVVEATAALKVRSASNLDDAVAALSARELAYVQSAPDLLTLLACLPRRAPPADTAWPEEAPQTPSSPPPR